MRIFVSYAHKQGDWVHQNLIPILRAAGAEVLLDIDHFKAGQTVIGQMDDLQSKAHRHILAITSDYVASDYCCHEMNQAVKADPGFAKSKTIAIRKDATPMPAELSGAGGLGTGPLYVNLEDDGDAAQWDLLLRSCDQRPFGTDVPNWLQALDQTQRHLERGESVNLVVKNGDVNWRTWFDHLTDVRQMPLAIVDLEDPKTVPRNGLIGAMLRATGRSNAAVPAPPDDMALLAEAFDHGARSLLALQHFDFVGEREHYGFDLFSSLRWLAMNKRQLVLLAHTAVPVSVLLPPRHKLSEIDFKTVELG